MSNPRRKRRRPRELDEPSAFRLQHGGIAKRPHRRDDALGARFLNEAESPLAWLARRKDQDGRPYLTPAQLPAGERLRADFTHAGQTPRVTANWIAPVAQDRRAAAPAAFADHLLAAKQRFARTLAALGPEFSGLLVDVCCFLKGLEAVERERRWPPRTARIVLCLGLDRLARHYGVTVEARGPARARMRAWQADDARPTMEGEATSS
jgi:hypothetical protein